MAPWWLHSSTDEGDDEAPSETAPSPKRASRSKKTTDERPSGDRGVDKNVSPKAARPKATKPKTGSNAADAPDRAVKAAPKPKRPPRRPKAVERPPEPSPAAPSSRWGKKPRQVSAVSAADIIPDDELFDDDAFRDELDDLLPDDLLPEDLSPEDLLPEDLLSEDLQFEDRPGETAGGAFASADEPWKAKKKRKKKNRKKRDEDKGYRPAAETPRRAKPARTTTPAVQASAVPSSESADVVFVPELGAVPEIAAGGERKIAVFIDFENIALGIRESPVIRDFNIGLFLERLLEKGKITVKRAYADWDRYSDLKRSLHEVAVELIDIPQKFYAGKTAADVKLVVDALDVCFTKPHLDTFVLVSGDGNFAPLVSKLKENDKYVIGLGIKNASSSLLIDNCDEFIYYEDAERDSRFAPRVDHLPTDKAECFQLMIESMAALLRDSKGVLWGSVLKQTMKRKKPSFSEGAFGYGSFSELLLDAEKQGLIRLRRDPRSGSYVVEGFAR